MKRSGSILTLALIVPLLAGLAGWSHAATLIVEPGERIQDHIDAAADDDVIVVLNGIHAGEGNYNIDFRGKAIELRSVAGRALCIIAVQGGYMDPRRAFIFQSGEDANSIINDLTITGGFVIDQPGGAIACIDGSSPTIRNCTIVGNTASGPLGVGGAIACINSSPTIENNTITGNHAAGSYGGGGIYCYVSNAQITRNTILGNNTFYDGGGLYAILGTPQVAENEFVYNGAVRGGGMCNWLCPAEITNNLFARNEADDYGGALYCRENPPPAIVNNTFTESNLLGGGEATLGREIAFYEIDAHMINSIILLNEAVLVDAGAAAGNVIIEGDDGSIDAADERTLTAPSVADWTQVDPPIIAGTHVVVITAIDPTIVAGTYGIAAVNAGNITLAGNAGSGACEYSVQEPDTEGGGATDIAVLRYTNLLVRYCLLDRNIYTEAGSSYAALQCIDAADLEPGDVFVAPGTTPEDHGTDYHLVPTSIALDAGDIGSDYSREPYPNGNRINLGTYGNTETATTSPSSAIIIEGPDDRAEAPLPSGPATVRIDIWGENLASFAGMQVGLKFRDSADNAAAGFEMSTAGGDPNYGGLAVVVPEDGGLFTLADSNRIWDTTLGRRTVGFILDVGDDFSIGPDVDPQPRTQLLQITYDYTAAVPDGTYTVELNPLISVVAGTTGPIGYQTLTGSVTINAVALACEGDVNDDGAVGILDMIAVRNNLNKDPASSDEAKAADVNGDGMVNILDMLYVRTRLGQCIPIPVLP